MAIVVLISLRLQRQRRRLKSNGLQLPRSTGHKKPTAQAQTKRSRGGFEFEFAEDGVFLIFQQCRNGSTVKLVRASEFGSIVSNRPVCVQPDQQQKFESRRKGEEKERGGGPVCSGPEVLLPRQDSTQRSIADNCYCYRSTQDKYVNPCRLSSSMMHTNSPG